MRAVPASSLLALAVSLGLAVPVPLAAQQDETPAPAPAPAPASSAPAATGSQIVVTAQSMRGAVDAPQPPVLELNEQDIAAYGAGSIAELIEALSPVTGSGSGRGGGFPVILVNGTRVSSFRELASYPPEAIQRVEVLSEEVAQRFGYSPNERVVNIILKRSYASREIEVEFGQPWDGDTSTKEADGTYLQIAGDSRLNFDLQWNDTSLLTEAERGVIQSPESIPTYATDPDPALYRSLVADSAGVQATGNWTTRLNDNGMSLSVNGTFQRNDTLRYQGLDTVLLTDPGGATALRSLGDEDPLTVDTRTSTYSLGTTLNARLGDWQITGTADASRADSRSRTQRRADTSGLQAVALAGTLALDADLPTLPDAGFDQADSQVDTLNSKLTAMGRPVVLPGGEVTVTFDTGYDWTGFDSTDTYNPGVETSLSRGNLNAGINVSVPITSRREEFGEEIGDLTLNFAGGVDDLSDFGTLTDWNVGLNWAPLERLNFSASYLVRDAAPSLGQLGNPEVVTPNVPVYDISRNETVLATIITGGNPLLPAQSQRDWRVGVNWQLPQIKGIQQGRLTLEYFNNHSEDVAAAFPILTPEIEAAFPDRVSRDSTGRLVSIDQRPVSYSRQDSQRIQAGLTLTGPFGKARPQAQQQNNPIAQVFQAANQGQGGQGPGGPGGGFNPQAFQQLRTRFCAPDAATLVPGPADVEGLPPQLLERLRNPDGTVNPERWAEFRTQMCSGNFTGGGDPQRFAQLREQICGRPGEPPPAITEEQLAALPPQMLERLKGPDGKIDPERVNQLRTQFCANPQPGQGGQGGGQQGGPGQSGPIIIIQGPGGQGGPGGPGGGFGGGGGGGQGGPGGGFGGGGGGGFRGPGGGGGGGFFGGNSPDGRGRWFANLTYSYLLENEVLIAPGVPVLDLLDGDALQGALPRHTVQFTGGLFYGGFGLNANARYIGPSRIDGSGLPGSTTLYFGDLATFNLRLFADLNQRTGLIEKVPLLKNTRITLGINNVLDSRQVVVDDTGTVPLRYQPFLIDPVGRFVEIELRKLF